MAVIKCEQAERPENATFHAMNHRLSCHVWSCLCLPTGNVENVPLSSSIVVYGCFPYANLFTNHVFILHHISHVFSLFGEIMAAFSPLPTKQSEKSKTKPCKAIIYLVKRLFIQTTSLVFVALPRWKKCDLRNRFIKHHFISCIDIAH